MKDEDVAFEAGTGQTDSFCGIFRPANALERPRIALFGAPWDAASSFRPGARLGPRQIRDMARSLSATSERGDDLTGLDAVDWGDLVLPTEVRRAEAMIAVAAARAHEHGVMPIVLGGDHAITVPAFKAALDHHPGLSLLVLDAHPDLYPTFDDDPFSHATVSHRIAHLPGMSGDRITHVGIRATNPNQKRVAQALGITTVPISHAADFTCRMDSPLYVSIDIDVLDPACAPGCGNPVPGGLTSRQLFDLIHRIAPKIVGFDVVEVNPLLDTHGITALAAVRVVTEMLDNIRRRRDA